jgi:hypothetical protein
VKKFILLFFILNLYPLTSFGFIKGFNQAWLKNHYGLQWLDRNYDPKYVEKIFKLNKKANSSVMRIWIFEGMYLEQFDRNNDGSINRIKPEILKNLHHFLNRAKKNKINIYLTFLDGNAFNGIINETDYADFWWSTFNIAEPYQNNFYVKAIEPVYALINKDFKSVVTHIDIVNEVNALVNLNLIGQQKDSLKKFLCNMAQNSPAPFTASLGWLNAEEVFLSGLLKDSCLDFYDIHFYNDSGVIPHCEELKAISQKGTKLFLGEFGQSNYAFDDELQKEITQNFLANAYNCGFFGAMPWRLEDIRPGFNPEARFSYVAFGKHRPAFKVFKKFSPPKKN